MKRSIYTLFLMTLISVSSFAQTTYTISANDNWSASIPTTCINCTINISNNIVLTIDKSVTCMNCTISGGSITDNNQAFSLLYAGTQTTTYFQSTALNVYGTGTVTVNAPLSLTNTTFTFNNNSTFTTSYEVDLTASTINLYDASSMTSTGGASTPIKLMSRSQINVGNGSQTSTSTFNVSGPTLTLYDKSSVTLGNDNNYYSNWANYSYYPSVNANAHASKSLSTLNNTISCGSGFPHSCANPFVYGPSTIGSAGVTTGMPLPIVLENFTATLNSDKTVTLDWNTAQEANSSHITIQRSADGENWDEIGMVQAKGNSALTTAYSFVDEHPLSGNNFYRLQLVDIDNSFTYSEENVIHTSTIGAISFFPNPAHDYVNVSLGNALQTGETVSVRLISLGGQVMQEQRTAANAGTVASFRVSNYAAGIYILSVAGQDGTQESRELVIGH
ncbi:MAG TPA: T9SS type A sorting domain-containing protein [Puia sp.]|nr:T9SS type A sorting domain-containing protein [Puia sp.]